MKKIKILSLFVCLIALLAACEDEDITPVSYTHLDVYKRQCHEFPQEGELGAVF